MKAYQPTEISRQIAVIVLLILGFTCSALEAKSQKTGQPPDACSQEIADKITLRGFKLGTPPDDYFHIPGFKAAYEKSKAPDPKIDILRTRELGSVMVRSSDVDEDAIKTDEELFEQLGDISFSVHFLDNKISTIIVKYQEFETPNLADFQNQVHRTLGLPTTGWVREHIGQAYMICGDVEIEISTGRIPEKSYYLGWPTIVIGSRSSAVEFRRRIVERKRAEDLQKNKAEEEALEKKRQEEMRRRTLRP